GSVVCALKLDWQIAVIRTATIVRERRCIDRDELFPFLAQLNCNVRHGVPSIMNSDEQQHQRRKGNYEQTSMCVTREQERGRDRQRVGNQRQTHMPEPVFKDESIRRQPPGAQNSDKGVKDTAESIKPED